MEDETKETLNEETQNSKIENIETENNKKEKKKKEGKNPKKSFIIKYVIFVIVLSLLTAGACYYTIVYKNKNNVAKIPKEKIAEVTNNAKQKAEDSIYAITSYEETYDENSINLEMFYYRNGEVYKEYPGERSIDFYQISGLKDKAVEEKINKKLKDDLIDQCKENGDSAYTYVTGNFNNILSLVTYSYSSQTSGADKVITTNIDLNTGEDIPFEKVFVSSAPIKSMLIEGLYETLSWHNDSAIIEGESWEAPRNMDNADTSDYEDKSILLARNYEKQKDNISFSISPTLVTVFGLIDEKIIDDEYADGRITIKLYKYIEEIAIYKRYLSSDSLFEDDSIGTKDTLVFTYPRENSEYSTPLYFGKIEDNIFLEEEMSIADELDNKKILTDFIDQKSKEFRNEIKNDTPADKGAFYQRRYGGHYYYNFDYSSYNQEYYVVYIDTSTTLCSRDYFKENGFRDLVKLKGYLHPYDTGGYTLFFYEYNEDDFPNLSIKNEYQQYFLDLDGNIVATSQDDMKEIILKRVEEDMNEYFREQYEKRQKEEAENSKDESLIGEYTDAPENNMFDFSAKLVIKNVTDSTIDFSLSASNETNVADISGTAKKTSGNAYYYDEPIEGAENGLIFVVSSSDYIYVNAANQDGSASSSEQNLFYVGAYKKSIQ